MKSVAFALATLLAAFAAARLSAQSFQTLCFFNGTNGANPVAALTLGTDGNFYGTTSAGGTNNNGTVFKVTTDDTLITLVTSNSILRGELETGLTLGSDGNFYGTAVGGYYGGTVFKMTTNGVLTTLVTFVGTNGLNPETLTLGTDGNFYGTTAQGGSYGDGTVFKVTTNGVLTTLVSFANTNGLNPEAALTLGNDGDFYGTTARGGSYGGGTVFKVTTNGVLTTLVSFANTNGLNPEAALTLGNDGNFYGTTSRGYYGGTVFKVTTNGVLTTLVTFNYPPNPQDNNASPVAALTLGSDGNFYGTTSGGGSYNDGTVFKMTTNGVLTTLVSFAGTNGAEPEAGLTLGSDGNAYGTTSEGGSYNRGTVFRLLFPPVITAPTMLANGQFQLSFNTATRADYAVQYSTNLTQWFPLVTISGFGIPLTLIDPNTAGSQQRFYRIILSPQ